MGRWEYEPCSLCGATIHVTEHCCCTDNLICKCGKCEWDVSYQDIDGVELECSACGSPPLEETGYFVTYHKARKDHTDGRIAAGDYYRKSVTVGFFPGAGLHRIIEKQRITKDRYDSSVSRARPSLCDQFSPAHLPGIVKMVTMANRKKA